MSMWKSLGSLFALGINATNRDGWTQLHVAVLEGKAEGLTRLLERGADPNVRGTKERTPLHLAALSGRMDLAELLIMKGANLHFLDSANQSAIGMAVERGHTGIVELLLDKGADTLDGPSSSFMPLLHKAAASGRTDIVSLLIARGADVNAIGPNGAMALCEAEEGGHYDIAALLVERGARGVTACNNCRGILCRSCAKVLRSCRCGMRILWEDGKEPQCFRCSGKSA